MSTSANISLTGMFSWPTVKPVVSALVPFSLIHWAANWPVLFGNLTAAAEVWILRPRSRIGEMNVMDFSISCWNSVGAR